MRPAQIRQAVVAHLLQALPSWRESSQVYGRFPDAETHPQIDTPLFAVGVLATEPARRQRRHVGMHAVTTFGVRFAVPLRADASVEDYDAALGREVDLIEALTALKSTCPLAAVIESVARDASRADGTVFVGDVLCSVSHLYPLT